MPPTTYLINKMLNHVFNVEAYTAASLVYLGFSTTAINASGSDSPVTEPTDSAYDRIAITSGSDMWSESTAGTLANLVSASFVQSTESWGTLVSAFLAEGSTASATILFYDTLSPSLPVPSNTEVTIGVGKITATMS